VEPPQTGREAAGSRRQRVSVSAQAALVKAPAFRYTFRYWPSGPAIARRDPAPPPKRRFVKWQRPPLEGIMDSHDKVLIIDDNEEVLAALRDYFSQKDYEVFSATNGLDGLKLLESGEHDFNLIITDLVMPTISGVGIISIVKKKRPDIPVVAITGWGEHLENLASEANADYILEKPFELSDLEDVLRKVTEQK
jgi:CheY-like chemotaxis protein